MKKFLSFILALSLLCSFSAILASCNDSHVHSFSEEWQYDSAHHWHDCTGEDCLLVSELAEHVWGEETEVILEASPKRDGIAKKKCTICGQDENFSVAFEGLSENKWDAMISDAAFENYTLTTESTMKTEIGGVDRGTSDSKSVVKIAADKIEISSYAYDSEGNASDALVSAFEGEYAKAHKEQYSMIFMLVLSEYENFEYDAETNTYKIEKTLTIEDDLPGFAINGDGTLLHFTVPAKIEIKNGEASISDDGKLLSFTCDYSQTMYGDNDYTVAVSGITTWTFSDYGTTVID